MSSGQGPVVGWMSWSTAGQWPGVLLHRDALVVQAPADVLASPPGDLVVQVGTETRQVAEVLTIVERSTGVIATGMIRLAEGVDGAPSVRVDRAAVARAWTDGLPLWSVLRSLRVVPVCWPAGVRPRTTFAARPAVIAVKSVAAIPANWCTIFWWLS